MSLNIYKINSLLCLFEKAGSLSFNDSPLITHWWTTGCQKSYDETENIVEANFEDDGMLYECNLTAKGLSDSIIKNGIITVKDENGDDCDICLFKLEKLISSAEGISTLDLVSKE